MRQGVRLSHVAALCAGLALQACVSAPQPSVSRAFFLTAPEDAAAVEAVIHEQERQLQLCADAQACDRVHYLRALAALYEDRNVAVKHFQAAARTSNGRYVASSLHWIRLLEDGGDGAQDQAALRQAMERLVRDLLARETAADARQKDAQSVQSLKRQLKEREKQIDELTQQIDALKRVDQEVKDRIKPRRPAN